MTNFPECLFCPKVNPRSIIFGYLLNQKKGLSFVDTATCSFLLNHLIIFFVSYQAISDIKFIL